MTAERDSTTLQADQPADANERLDGVVIGVLLGIDDAGVPLVAFPGNPVETAVPARTTARLDASQVGREVALLFEGADPTLPVVIGLLHRPSPSATTPEPRQTPTTAKVDGERVVLTAEKEIVLKCGKASITLTRAGKVLIRGAYLLSRSSGANRIKGGSVQLN
jgi:hypothetical protein